MIESDAFFGLNGVTEFKLGDNDVEIRLGEKLIYPIPQEMRMLTFVATETGTFKFSGNSVNYSLDNGVTWRTLASNTNTPTVPAGGKIMFKAALTPSTSWPYGIGTFSSTGRFTAQGNPMSLLYGDNFIGQTSLSGKDYAFYGLFRNCTGLTSAENISFPATALAMSCYGYMFYGCTSLTTAPTLPATTLVYFCYQYMFQGCTSLTTAPVLSATTLGVNCYYYMFSGCTSLTTAPSLPATTLADGCYNAMFSRCTSLTAAPQLPATTLASNCYWNMFQGCTSLTTAPVLSETTLASGCYQGMFSGCTSLTIAPELPATTLTSYCYSNMFCGCTSLTTAPVLPATTLGSGCYDGMFSGCTSLTTAPVLPATTLAESCYSYMFSGCTSLTTAPELSATTLATHCYNSMFAACTGLTTAPILPATTMVNYCYKSMFNGCTSLAAAPELPATTMAYNCYDGMFKGCTSLTTAPELPATTLTSYCYQSMFNGCTSLTTVPSVLPATTLAFSCYASMFGGCTSLTTAPELPATTLTYWCYSNMFSGCTNLNKITCLATNISANGCTSNWVNGVAATGTFIKGPSMTGWTTGNDGIPSGWTVKDYGQSLILYDYIENTGTSYIDTTYEIGLNNMNTIKYYVDFVATEYNRGNNWWAHGIGGGEPFIYVGLDNGSSSSTNIPFVYGGGNRDVTTSAYGSLNQRYKCLIDYQNLTYKVTNEGGSVLLDSIITIQAPSTSTARSPYLFAWRRGSDGALGYTHSGRIYACTIFANNVCVRNLIPCIYNGTPGMYDTVNNQFHGNLGGGTFIVGNRI